MSEAGRALWITGLPATGKSMLARALIDALHRRGRSTLWLDSDDLRTVLTPSPQYTDAERDWFYGAIAHLAKLGVDGNTTVVISATAPKRSHRDRARALVPRFTEIYLTCPISILRARDPKGLYRRSENGELPYFPGSGATYEPPLAPEVTLDSGAVTTQEMVDLVLALISL